ncbi:hypothetical protein DXN05_24185 [Deminuibacter soli]|uniref:Uncharacterized protein n=2 Tax=Deminuibacter soli TaxID=2291815 RepID=A0A3E1NCS9_9BACT|nr:hypothetical protein DXN05_24185 [Deminuibacter soli]
MIRRVLIVTTLLIAVVFFQCRRPPEISVNPEAGLSSEWTRENLEAELSKAPGNYKGGTVAFADKSGRAASTASLDWHNALFYEADTATFFEVPFRFKNSDDTTTRYLINKDNRETPSRFELVFVKNRATAKLQIKVVETILIRERQFKDRLPGLHYLIKNRDAKGYELVFDLDGNKLEEYSFSKNQKIPKFVAGKGMLPPVTCDYYPTVTYDIICTGGTENGTTCTYVPNTTYVYVCTSTGGSPGGGGGDGVTPSPLDPDLPHPLPGGGSVPSDEPLTIAGPHICKSAIVLASTGAGANTNTCIVNNIPAVYFASEGTFSATFSIQVWAPNDVSTWGVGALAASHIQYAELWDDYYIYTHMESGGVHYTFSVQAQQAIIAQAIDYASLKAEEALLQATNGKTQYMQDFKSYFLTWVRQYMPGTSITVTGGTLPGGIPFASGPSDNNC